MPDLSYPARASDVTAETLCRAHTVAAQRAWLRLHACPDRLDTHPETPEWRHWQAVLVGEYRAARLLRSLQEHAPHVADHVARQMWETLDAGEPVGDQLHAWLADHGIDPLQVPPAQDPATGRAGRAHRANGDSAADSAAGAPIARR